MRANDHSQKDNKHKNITTKCVIKGILLHLMRGAVPVPRDLSCGCGPCLVVRRPCLGVSPTKAPLQALALVLLLYCLPPLKPCSPDHFSLSAVLAALIAIILISPESWGWCWCAGVKTRDNTIHNTCNSFILAKLWKVARYSVVAHDDSYGIKSNL